MVIGFAAASKLGLRLYRMSADVLPANAGELETLARLVEREIALWPFALYLDSSDGERAATSETQAPPLNRFLDRTGGGRKFDRATLAGSDALLQSR